MKNNAAFIIGLVIAAVLAPRCMLAADGSFGYTRPFRTSELAAAEAGIIAEILVVEGDRVSKSQVLARLNCEVLQATLELARAEAASVGAINAAQAELGLRQRRLDRLTELKTAGHARVEEFARADTDVQIAAANLRTAVDQQAIKALQVKQIQAQIERRTVRAPFDGIITTIHREVGESATADVGKVFTLVQLDKLRATIHLAGAEVASLKTGAETAVVLGVGRQSAKAKVSYISPLIDPASGTVRTDLVIDNPTDKFRSGARIRLANPAAGAESKSSPAERTTP